MPLLEGAHCSWGSFAPGGSYVAASTAAALPRRLLRHHLRHLQFCHRLPLLRLLRCCHWLPTWPLHSLCKASQASRAHVRSRWFVEGLHHPVRPGVSSLRLRCKVCSFRCCIFCIIGVDDLPCSVPWPLRQRLTSQDWLIGLKPKKTVHDAMHDEARLAADRKSRNREPPPRPAAEFIARCGRGLATAGRVGQARLAACLDRPPAYLSAGAVCRWRNGIVWGTAAQLVGSACVVCVRVLTLGRSAV